MAKKTSTTTKKTQAKEKPEVELKPGQKIGSHGKPVPLSERERKYKEWSKQACIDHLRELAKQHPDMFISRNWFRSNSNISDATWNRHFGTFNEFRRSAGLELSRWQHRVEKQIGKHAGADVIDALNTQKMSYHNDKQYVRPRGQRFQTVMAMSDYHDEFHDPFWRRVWLDTLERVQPSIIILNGDIFDLAEFSRWEQDPREWDITRKMNIALDFIRDCREACPDAQIDFIEGNHEYRLFKHLSEATPALKTVLADLHGFDIPKLLGLDEFEVNFIGEANLKAWTERDIKKELNRNYQVYFDGAFLACHYPDRRKLGMPGFGGHHHKHEVWPIHQASGIAGEFHQMGAAHYRAASYCDGQLWHMGFMIVHVDTETKNTNFEYVPISDHAVVGGAWYTRRKPEIIT